MTGRITPAPGMVVQFFHNQQSDERPLPGRITKIWMADLVDVEYTEDGETKSSNKVQLGHALDSVPISGAYAKHLPRHDVASERHLLHPDRSATEGSPQRGESPDPRVPPTVEHVSEEDPVARGQMGLPAEKTQDEKVKEKAGGIPSTKEDAEQRTDEVGGKSKSEEKRHAAKGPDPSLSKRK